jgi:hypothetical protein
MGASAGQQSASKQGALKALALGLSLFKEKGNW